MTNCSKAWFIGAPLVAALACGRADRSGQSDTLPARPIRILAADLAASVAVEDDVSGTLYLHRVAVRTDRSTDTLRGVVTAQRPFLVGDSVVYGLMYDAYEHR
jgi:hypothetical protein